MSKMPKKLWAWRYNESDRDNDRVKCTTLPDKNAPQYLLTTPLLAHAEELKNQLKVMADLFHYDFPRSFCAEIRAVDSLLAKITAEERKQNETLQINE